MLKPVVKAPVSKNYMRLRDEVRALGLHTVCEEAACPNIGECWEKKHLTIMIMGGICTRACAFCNISTGKPMPLDPLEPKKTAQMVKKLDVRHVVVTSVDRDDLRDGGAEHFSKTIKALRDHKPHTTIEILTPDFLRKPQALDILSKHPPDVFNHNLETVPRLYKRVRPGARYFNSLKLLADMKQRVPHVFTKSGLMVGLGEEIAEVAQVMDDLRCADVDFLTIGQYLQPTPQHYPVRAYVSDEQFSLYKDMAFAKGFLMVSASPLTRSSYHAAEDFEILKNARSYSSNS